MGRRLLTHRVQTIVPFNVSIELSNHHYQFVQNTYFTTVFIFRTFNPAFYEFFWLDIKICRIKKSAIFCQFLWWISMFKCWIMSPTPCFFYHVFYSTRAKYGKVWQQPANGQGCTPDTPKTSAVNDISSVVNECFKFAPDSEITWHKQQNINILYYNIAFSVSFYGTIISVDCFHQHSIF